MGQAPGCHSHLIPLLVVGEDLGHVPVPGGDGLDVVVAAVGLKHTDTASGADTSVPAWLFILQLFWTPGDRGCHSLCRKGSLPLLPTPLLGGNILREASQPTPGLKPPPPRMSVVGNCALSSLVVQITWTWPPTTMEAISGESMLYRPFSFVNLISGAITEGGPVREERDKCREVDEFREGNREKNKWREKGRSLLLLTRTVWTCIATLHVLHVLSFPVCPLS